MIYLRCKCGESQWFGSDWPRPCQGCPACGTTYATRPEDHGTPAPHKPQMRYSSMTGEPKGYRCAVCFESCNPPEAAP